MGKRLIAMLIAFRPIAARMGLAIDLDREPRVMTGKIEAAVADGMLAAEFESSGAFPQFTPEQDFGEVPAPAFATGGAVRGVGCI